MESLPHSEFDVVVVKTWFEVHRAEDSFLPLLQFTTLPEPKHVKYLDLYFTEQLIQQHVGTVVTLERSIHISVNTEKR